MAIICIKAADIDREKLKGVLSGSNKSRSGRLELTGDIGGAYFAVVENPQTAISFQTALVVLGVKHRQLTAGEAAQLSIRPATQPAPGQTLGDRLASDPDVFAAMKQFVLDTFKPQPSPFAGGNFTTGKTFQ